MTSVRWRTRRLLRLASTFTLLVMLAGGLLVGRSLTARAAAFEVGDYLTVDTNALNLRDAPSLDGGVILTMSYGTEVVVKGGPKSADGYTWYKVQYAGSTTGWAAGEYLTTGSSGNPLEPGTHNENFPVGAVVMVDTDRLKFHADPSLDADVIDVLTYETVGLVVDGPVSESGYHWYQVSLGSDGSGDTGWMIGEGLAMLGGAEPPDDGGGEFGIGDGVFVDMNWLNLREDPGTDGGIVTALPYGTSGDVTDGPVSADGYSWYLVDFGGDGQGWVAGEYLSRGDVGGTTFSVGDAVHVVDGSLNLRDDHSRSADIIDVMSDGTELMIEDGPMSSGGYTWYQVSSDTYGTGWAAGEYLALSS